MSTPTVPSPPPPDRDGTRVAAFYAYDLDVDAYVGRCPGCRTILTTLTGAEADRAPFLLPVWAPGPHTCPDPCGPLLEIDLGVLYLACGCPRGPGWLHTWPEYQGLTEADVVALFAAHRTACRARETRG